jgi:16S rRNA (uracil1498-N3)-methyltransferase
MVPRFFAPEIDPDAPTVTLSDEESHHARHVLRLRFGDVVGVFDGRGREWTASVQLVAARRVILALRDVRKAVPEPPVAVTLAAALLKSDHMDAVVRDATMLGVVAILPLLTTHVVVPKAARTSSAIVRWQRVAVSSAKQCGRAVVPEVREPVQFRDALSAIAASKLICVEPGTASSRTVPPAPPRDAMLLIGPEGGWAAEEIDQALEAGAIPISLGSRTLRADAAPIVALSMLWTTWGW